jgi:hypothetical protein
MKAVMRTLVVLITLGWLSPALSYADAGRSPEELRQICAAAMNADPTFATSIVKTINEKTAKKHADAAEEIATNEHHVILAYAAMWVVAALFLIFLWRRQVALRAELARLKRDLEAAIEEPAK